MKEVREILQEATITWPVSSEALSVITLGYLLFLMNVEFGYFLCSDTQENQ